MWTSRGSLGAHFVQGDYFGEQALLVDEPRAASVQATSQKVECLVVDRRAYEQATKSSSGLLTDDNPNASSKKDVYYQRTSATKDVEMMWRRLRFQKELETVPLLATLSLYERSLLAKQYVSGVSFFSEIPFGIKTLLFKEQSRRIQNLCVSQIRHTPWRPDYG